MSTTTTNGRSAGFTIRRPISSDPSLRREGAVVSRHRTLEGAREALERQQRGARKQGGYSQDYIWNELADREEAAR